MLTGRKRKALPLGTAAPAGQGRRRAPGPAVRLGARRGNPAGPGGAGPFDQAGPYEEG
ncbi:hypothetical protein O1L55_20550 [Streptomyces albulus]|nr:hypothetical protein [Streptomyces noursei]